MAGGCLREAALDGLVHIHGGNLLQRDGEVAIVHDRQVLDVFHALDGNAGLHPGGAAVGPVRHAVLALVDGVIGIRVAALDIVPGPCPGEIGELDLAVIFLFDVLVAVDRGERAKDGVLDDDVLLRCRCFLVVCHNGFYLIVLCSDTLLKAQALRPAMARQERVHIKLQEPSGFSAPARMTARKKMRQMMISRNVLIVVGVKGFVPSVVTPP